MLMPTLTYCICVIIIRINTILFVQCISFIIRSIFLCCQRYRCMRQQPVDTVYPLPFVYHMQALTAWATLRPVDVCICICLIDYVHWKHTSVVLTLFWACTGQPWSSRSFILGMSPSYAASRNACSSPCTGDTTSYNTHASSHTEGPQRKQTH